MQTIKEITEQLRTIEEPVPWMETLKEDQRTGVKKALASWQKRYDKKLLIKEAYQSKKVFDASFKPFSTALVAGIDEAGRGPLAGPVVTAAVILPEDTEALLGLDDSKSITKEKREELATKIRELALAYTVHIQPAEKIDELNIYRATKESMEQAVRELPVKPDFVIADAMQLMIDCPTSSVIKADAKSLVVAAASILAKTTRDRLMDQIDEDFPMYHFKKNAGYGTADHVKALKENGPCIHHRKTFEPVKSMIGR